MAMFVDQMKLKGNPPGTKVFCGLPLMKGIFSRMQAIA